MFILHLPHFLYLAELLLMKVFMCFFYVSSQVRVLTDLGMFSEATRVLCALLHGEKLPKISDVGFRTVENKTV